MSSEAGALEIRPDMDAALADLAELNGLSRLFGFDLVGDLARITNSGAPVLFCEVSSAPAVGTDYLVARFQLHERLQGALAALRARNGNAHFVHSDPPDKLVDHPDRLALTDDILSESHSYLMLCGDRYIAIEDYRAGVELLLSALRCRGWELCRAVSASHCEESTAKLSCSDNNTLVSREGSHLPDTS